jgi:hypothetical protein
LADVNRHIGTANHKELAMSFQPNRTADIQDIKPRHHVALLLAILGLAALAPTGASACGQLPPGVEVTGPILRGAVAPAKVKVQPVITPHCYLAPPADGVGLNGPGDRPDDSAASPDGRLIAAPAPGGSR